MAPHCGVPKIEEGRASCSGSRRISCDNGSSFPEGLTREAGSRTIGQAIPGTRRSAVCVSHQLSLESASRRCVYRFAHQRIRRAAGCSAAVVLDLVQVRRGWIQILQVRHYVVIGLPPLEGHKCNAASTTSALCTSHRPVTISLLRFFIFWPSKDKLILHPALKYDLLVHFTTNTRNVVSFSLPGESNV